MSRNRFGSFRRASSRSRLVTAQGTWWTISRPTSSPGRTASASDTREEDQVLKVVMSSFTCSVLGCTSRVPMPTPDRGIPVYHGRSGGRSVFPIMSVMVRRASVVRLTVSRVEDMRMSTCVSVSCTVASSRILIPNPSNSSRVESGPSIPW
jgi:hypothetical protein